MAGTLRKAWSFLGLTENGDYDDEAYVDDTEYQQVAPVTPIVRAAAPAPRESRGQEDDLKRIVSLHPRTYNDAKTIGEEYRSGVPVIINLSDLSDADAKRLVDFAAGLVFALHGNLERVTPKVFLLSPEAVEVQVAASPVGRTASDDYFA